MEERSRQGHRRLYRGHPARSGIRRGGLQPRLGLVDEAGARQGLCRLQRGHPTRSRVRLGLLQPRRCLVCEGRLPEGHRRLRPRPSVLEPKARRRATSIPGRLPGMSKQDFDKAIADYTEAIRLDPKDASAHSFTGRRLESEAGFRPGDRRPRRGDPTRIPRTPWRTPAGALAWFRKQGIRPRPWPISARRSGSIRRPGLMCTTTGAPPGLRRRISTRRSPTTPRPSGSIPSDSRRFSLRGTAWAHS